MASADAAPDAGQPGWQASVRAHVEAAARSAADRPGEARRHAPAMAGLIDRPVLLGVLFVVAYMALDAGTDFFPVAPTQWTPWNPQAALALTLIAIGGLRYVPAVVAAVVLAEVLVRGAPAGAASLFAALAVAGAYCAAGYLVQRFTRWIRAEVTLRDLSYLVLIAFGASMAVALLVAVAHALAGTLSIGVLHVVSLQLVIGEALGLVVAAPALLLFSSGAWRIEAASTIGRGRLGRDLLLFVVAVAGLLLLIFWWRPFDQFRMSYLLFVPTIVIVTRHGLLGAVLAVPVIQVGLIASVLAFAPRAATAFEYQMLTLALAMTSMYLGVLSSERERGAQRLAARERELREQRTALSEAQRSAATAELSAALAHDLSQPLSAIGTYARAARLLAERNEADRATLFRTLEQISSESSRAGQYVRRMRDFFRTGTMHSEPVRAQELVERARVHLRDRLERDGIAFEAVFDPGLPPLQVDTVQAGAVLDNLLGNACDALAGAAPPRRIRVLAARLQGEATSLVRITVQDNGPGVPAELRPQLFRPLATTKPHGMGLGLALSRSIAERLGGGLSFDAASSITTFHLDLPTDEHRTE
jgi:signal transduction histidine kinase